MCFLFYINIHYCKYIYIEIMYNWGLPRWLSGKESACQCRSRRRLGFDPWVGKIPWRRTWLPTLASCLENPIDEGDGYSPWYCKEWDMTEWLSLHFTLWLVFILKLIFLSFPCGSARKEFACNVGNWGSIPGLGRFPGERKCYPLQYSVLENSTDCIVHGVTKSWSRLSDFHFH